jgi:phosphatidylcholine synthase
VNAPEKQVLTEPGPWARIAWAWLVHALTASGAVFGLLALIAITEERYILAFAWMGVTIAIDAVDGTLARLFQVKRHLPMIDGETLDNIMDYFTYVIVPAFFLYQTGIVPGYMGVFSCFAITLASAYQFCQTDAKTADFYFTGFPSYWNVLVFYLFFLGLPATVNLILVLILAVAVFVPVKYVYPSRTRALRPLTVVLSTAWGLMLLVVLLRYPEDERPLLYLSLVYVVYYFALSFFLTWRDWRHARGGAISRGSRMPTR